MKHYILIAFLMCASSTLMLGMPDNKNKTSEQSKQEKLDEKIKEILACKKEYMKKQKEGKQPPVIRPKGASPALAHATMDQVKRVLNFN